MQYPTSRFSLKLSAHCCPSHYLSSCLQDSESLKRFLHKEDIKQLPSEEEVWEVPKPPEPDITAERGMEGTQSDTSLLRLKRDHVTSYCY